MKVSTALIILTLASTPSINSSGRFSQFLRGGSRYDLSEFDRLSSGSFDAFDDVTPFDLSPLGTERKSSSTQTTGVSDSRKSDYKSSPRTSFSEMMRDSISSIRSSFGSLVSKRTSRSRSNSNEGEPGEHRVAAYGEKPEFLSSFINFGQVEPIKWEQLRLPNVKELEELQSSMQNIAEKMEIYDEDFTDKVLKTYDYVGHEFASTPFSLHLAAEMVRAYDSRAPIAINEFLSSKMPFLRSNAWPNSEFNGAILELNLCPSLDDPIRRLFFNMIHKGSNEMFHNLMIIYMQIFDGVKTITEFNDRYIRFIKVLTNVTRELDEGNIANFGTVQSTFIFSFPEFSAEIDKEFNLN